VCVKGYVTCLFCRTRLRRCGEVVLTDPDYVYCYFCRKCFLLLDSTAVKGVSVFVGKICKSCLDGRRIIDVMRGSNPAGDPAVCGIAHCDCDVV